MRTGERAKFVAEFIEKNCYSVMAAKGTEYSRGEEDCNSNFKRVAAALGLTPLQVAYVYGAKHWDSISNYAKTGETPSGEPIMGRIGDMVNYLLIFASLIKEAETVTTSKRLKMRLEDFPDTGFGYGHPARAPLAWERHSKDSSLRRSLPHRHPKGRGTPDDTEIHPDFQ